MIRSLGGWDEVKKIRLTGQGFTQLLTVAGLGMPTMDLARKFEITTAAVSYAVQRGEKRTKEQGYQLET